MRYCNANNGEFLTLCKIEIFFNNCSTISNSATSLCSLGCTTRYFGSSSYPVQIRKFHGFYREWDFFGSTYDLATGFILQGVGGVNYSIGTNHYESKGWFFTRGRPVGFRQNLNGNTVYDRFSLRVAKCSIDSNTSIYQVNAGG